jgi:hypothetical protein
MADYDPNRDFRDPNRLNESPNWDAEREANASWGWILGGLAAVVLVLVALSFARNDTQTASNSGNEPPISQTRPSSPTTVNPPPMNRPAPSSPSTTGQSSPAPQQ